MTATLPVLPDNVHSAAASPVGAAVGQAPPAAGVTGADVTSLGVPPDGLEEVSVVELQALRPKTSDAAQAVNATDEDVRENFTTTTLQPWTTRPADRHDLPPFESTARSGRMAVWRPPQMCCGVRGNGMTRWTHNHLHWGKHLHWPHQYANHHLSNAAYVGRVGALAVALGIGTATATGLCAACAYAATGDETAFSAGPANTSTSQQANPGVRGPSKPESAPATANNRASRTAASAEDIDPTDVDSVRPWHC